MLTVNGQIDAVLELWVELPREHGRVCGLAPDLRAVVALARHQRDFAHSHVRAVPGAPVNFFRHLGHCKERTTFNSFRLDVTET